MENQAIANESNACMPKSINSYFKKEIFTSRTEFVEKQEYNMKDMHLKMDEYSQHLSRRVQVREGEEYKRKILFTSTKFGSNHKYAMDTKLKQLINNRRYIIDYTYNKECENRLGGHFVCIEKKNGKLKVVSEPIKPADVLPTIKYKLNQKPNVKDKKKLLNKHLGIRSLQIFEYERIF